MPTQAQVRAVLAAVQAGPLSGANVNCTYQTDTFVATRTSLTSEAAAGLYGVGNAYQFSVYADKSDLTTEIRTDEKIIVSGDYGTTGTSPLSVMGSSVDAMSGLVRIDCKEANFRS